MNDRHRQYRFQETVQDQKTSALQKYQDIIIGQRSLTVLLRHELSMLLLGSLPGMAGLGLRKIFFPAMFGEVGKNVVFGHHITLRSRHKISIGNNSMIDDHVLLSFRGEEDQKIQIGNNVLVGRFSQIKARGGAIHLADNISIGPFCHFGTTSNLTVGEYALFGANCFIGGIQHGYSDTSRPIVEQPLTNRGGVHIGRDVWLGAHSVVNDGVEIGEGAIVGANAVVTKNIPPFTIAAGVPAKIIGQRESNIL